MEPVKLKLSTMMGKNSIVKHQRVRGLWGFSSESLIDLPPAYISIRDFIPLQLWQTRRRGQDKTAQKVDQVGGGNRGGVLTSAWAATSWHLALGTPAAHQPNQGTYDINDTDIEDREAGENEDDWTAVRGNTRSMEEDRLPGGNTVPSCLFSSTGQVTQDLQSWLGGIFCWFVSTIDPFPYVYY